MRVLIYKRTHKGDPDDSGCFGIFHCMGQVRGWEFNAVIGVGGIGSDAVKDRIDRKVAWIGIGRQQKCIARDGYPLWVFKRFYLKNEKGLLLTQKAPNLAKRILARYGPRVILVEANEEINAILKLAKNSPPSPALLGNKTKTVDSNCSPKKKH